MVPLFWGVLLVLRWYSVGILEFSAGVPPGNVQLFCHCSGVFGCSAGVPFSVFRSPGFIVCRKYRCQNFQCGSGAKYQYCFYALSMTMQ